MCSSDEASNGLMHSEAQLISFGRRGKVLHNGLVPRRITRIIRLAKADRKREYLFTNLAEICSATFPTETWTNLC